MYTHVFYLYAYQHALNGSDLPQVSSVFLHMVKLPKDKEWLNYSFYLSIKEDERSLGLQSGVMVTEQPDSFP